MKGERILYPCYFNATLMRKEGRRISKSRAVKDPTLADLESAVKRSGLSYRTEPKSFPGFWSKREGRIVVKWTEGKEALLKKVATHMDAKKPEHKKPVGRK